MTGSATGPEDPTDPLWASVTAESDWWQLNALLNHLLLRILRLESHSAGEVDVTERQHKALLFIKGAPSAPKDGWVPLQMLRRYLLADNATAAQLVGRLRDKGLVAVKRPARNGPAFVRLTPAGKAALAKISTLNRNALRELSAEIGPGMMPALVGHITRYLGGGDPGPDARH
ncbi:MAG: MarR family winged helix-turn-helix transcriptional regulator [Actinomycetota bacterium]